MTVLPQVGVPVGRRGRLRMKVERERQPDMNKRRREVKEDERARSGQIEDQWWSMKAQISDLQ
jgi:hypothetical protein